MNPNFIASSSKLLRSKGFATRAEAESQARDWEALAPTNPPRDMEAPAQVYTWQEWCDLAKQHEADPLEALEQ
jgi:hypothetical protein